MKVKVLDGVLVVNGKEFLTGKEVEVDDGEVARLVALGVAEPVGKGEAKAGPEAGKKKAGGGQ